MKTRQLSGNDPTREDNCVLGGSLDVISLQSKLWHSIKVSNHFEVPSTIQKHPIPMNVSYDPPQSLLALMPELKESSEKRVKINLFRVLSKLLGMIFFQEAPALATLRNALGDVYKPLLPDGLENHELLDKFFT